MLHLRKIDPTDEVLILTSAATLGESTAHEPAYARDHEEMPPLGVGHRVSSSGVWKFLKG